MLSLLVPGTMKESEIAAEALTVAVNLFSMYNESILSNSSTPSASSPPKTVASKGAHNIFFGLPCPDLKSNGSATNGHTNTMNGHSPSPFDQKSHSVQVVIDKGLASDKGQSEDPHALRTPILPHTNGTTNSPSRQSRPWHLQSPLHTSIAIVQHVELLIEMIAERWQSNSPTGKWPVLLAVEALKAVLRLALLAKNQGVVQVITPAILKRVPGPSTSSRSEPPSPSPSPFYISRGPASHALGDRLNSQPPSDYSRNGVDRSVDPPHTSVWQGKRSGKMMRSLGQIAQRKGSSCLETSSEGAIPRKCIGRINGQNGPLAQCLRRTNSPRSSAHGPVLGVELGRELDFMCDDSPPSTPTMRISVGEVLFILRPVLYLASICRYGVGSWKAWIVSLAVDLSSRALTGSLDALNPSERDEIRRRQLLYLYYIARAPFFDSVIRPPIAKIGEIVEPIPLVGSLVARALDIVFALQSFYTYTSAS